MLRVAVTVLLVLCVGQAVSAASGTWGPYIQHTKTDAILVRYWSTSSSELTLKLDDGTQIKENMSSRPTAFGKTRHEFTITGLSSKTGYTVDGKTGSIQPKKPASAKLVVGIYGDTKDVAPYHTNTIKAMISAGLDATVNGGDVTDDSTWRWILSVCRLQRPNQN